MSLNSELQDAAAEAQGYLAQMGGMSETASGNFIGPDGEFKTMVFRAADAFEQQSAAREMSLHGYTDRAVVFAVASRDQFDGVPLDWRRKKCARLVPAPATECLIADVSTDDPLFYTFVLLVRQPAQT